MKWENDHTVWAHPDLRLGGELNKKSGGNATQQGLSCIRFERLWKS